MMMIPPRSQPDLAHHLGGRLQVDLEHRLLEVALAHVLAGIDVDGHEGLGVVDDDVAAGLEPDPSPQRLLDLALDAGGLEDRRVLVPLLDPGSELGHELGGELEALLVGGGAVHQELLDLGREEIAHHPEGDVHLRVEQGRRLGRLGARQDLGPEPAQELDVGGQLLLPLALRDGPDNESPRLRGHSLDDGAEPIPLGVVVDPARDADVARLGHQNDVAARDGHERGHPRPLGAERLLRDLHQDLLALAQHLLDGRDRLPPRRGLDVAFRLALALVHVGGLLLRGRGLVLRAEAGGVVARVEKGVLGEPDVHERGLHAGQHVGDDALVDVADDGAPVGALDVQLGEEISILDGETRFRHTGVDDDALSHGRPRSGVPMGDPASNYAVSGTAAFGSRSGDPVLSARPPWRIRRSS